ncbi:MAG: C10 family peptidase, partial [Muribaculaceae bacterium]|nr:C10 family peptidase [Muribaculaceae bacterium]
MKKLSVLGMLILVAMFSFTAKADIITLDGANEIANAFFANSATSQKKQMKSITQLEYAWDSNSLKSQGSSMMKSVDEDPTFYVFNNPDGEGFVIVSGDDNARSVIGYSYEGNIPAADEIPAPMQDYLLGIDEEIKWARTNLTSSNKNLKATLNETGGTQEQYLETPSWGQNAPFNNLCPIINGSDGKGGCVDYHAKTGCVPTAFASVMRYHKWPVQGIGTILGSWTYDLCAGTKQDIRTETIDHAATTYDWDNMPLTYSDSWTEAQKTQVATLMRNVGYAFGVEYLQGATNYNEGKTIPTLVTSRFGYTYETVLWGQSGVSDGAITDTDEWISKLKESLDNYCPIPYGAKNWGTGDSRHMFVVDGYTSNNYFHFNFGWTGSGNGWFLITAVTPLTGDDYSWKTESKHRAYINFRPDTNVTVSVAVDGTGSAYIGQEDVTSTTVNFGDPITLTATGDNFVGWVVDGTIVSDDEEYTITASATKTYTAKFAQSYPLQVQATLDLDVEDTNNSVDQSADNVYIGAQVILTATPARGYAFDGWYFLGTETFEYKSNSLTYTATIEDSPWHSALGYIPVFAKFSQLSPVTITAASSDAAMGTAKWSFNEVEGNATTIVYPGEKITLTATPKSGYMFAGWTTDGTNVLSTSLEFTTTVPEQSNVTYTAKFTLAGADYYVNKETGTFGGITYNSRNSIWTYNTNTSSNPVPLQIKTTNASGTEVGAMTNAGSSSSSLKYYVYGGDSNNNITTPVTYTLSVPEGFIITGYE